MVCVRCKMIVKTVLDSLEIPYQQIELGRVKVEKELTPEKRVQLNAALQPYELALMDNSKKILVERIKLTIIDMFQQADGDRMMKFSEQLSKTLQLDYTYLANTFSEVEESTIEKYYILKKIERVKQLIIYEGMSIKEISYQLSYSSVSHLCKQFKLVTGLTPAKFKKSWESERFA